MIETFNGPIFTPDIGSRWTLDGRSAWVARVNERTVEMRLGDGEPWVTGREHFTENARPWEEPAVTAREHAYLAESYGRLLDAVQQLHRDLLVDSEVRSQSYYEDAHLNGIAQGQAQRGAAIAGILGAIANQAMLRAIEGGK